MLLFLLIVSHLHISGQCAKRTGQALVYVLENYVGLD